MTKQTSYDPDDPEDIGQLVLYVLSTMAKHRRLPKGYDVEDCLGMAYSEAIGLCKSFDPDKGHSFESYVFAYLPNRFHDYFMRYEVGKKKNIVRKNGKAYRPKDEPRYVDKALTNFAFKDDGYGKGLDFAVSSNQPSIQVKTDNKIVFSNLNKNEMDVVYLIARGMSQKGIGSYLGISESRVSQLKYEVKTKCRLESKAYVLEDNEYSV